MFVAGGTATVCTAPHAATASGSQAMQVASADVSLTAEELGLLGDGSAVTLAAASGVSEYYNGKLAAPAVWSEALDLSVWRKTHF